MEHIAYRELPNKEDVEKYLGWWETLAGELSWQMECLWEGDNRAKAPLYKEEREFQWEREMHNVIFLLRSIKMRYGCVQEEIKI